MTEIPEHLLKRSRERRQAMGLPGGEGAGPVAESGGSTEQAAAPATPTPAKVAPARAAAPAPAPTPAAPPPDPPYVAAAKRRGRIPFWALPVVAILPVWMILYANAMRPKEVEVVGPLAAGAEVYGKCASCHGTGGEGGVGYPLYNGEVFTTFPAIDEMLTFVYVGTQGFDGVAYSSTGRHIGGARGLMPQWGATAGGELSDLEILEVICHERYTLSGGDQTSEEYLQWCDLEGEKYLQVVEGGFEAAGVPTTGAG